MPRFPLTSTAYVPERAILVGVEWRDSSWPLDKSLDELERLADTAGAQVVGRMTQRLETPTPKTFIGSGKVLELKQLVSSLDVDTVIFDDELTPSQQANLEKLIGSPTKIIDRTALILDIFGLHARTKEGRLQVQLAQLQYLLPRLRGMWSHLAGEQTRGGIGSRFGQGESQLEVDRRLIRDKISSLKKELKALEKRREVQSKSRYESYAYRIALAGYTNAGKSTLLNQITGSNVLSQDKLFATLDPTTRSYALPGGREITITDTVGFIQKLPHNLVESFKSTLLEVKKADLILEVIDASDPENLRQIDAVNEVLKEIHAEEQTRIIVYNKCDLVPQEQIDHLVRITPSSVAFSALTGQGREDLINLISEVAAQSDETISIHIPYKEGELLRIIHEQSNVLHEEYTDTGADIVLKAPNYLTKRLEQYIITA